MLALIFGLALQFGGSSWSKVWETPANSKDPIVRKFGAAVVHIAITGQNNFKSSGTAFFISPDGWLITNYHVMEPLFARPGTSRVTFQLANGELFSDFLIGKCSISVSWLDLCLLKLNTYPDKWFHTKKFQPKPGTVIHSIWRAAGSAHGLNRNSGKVIAYDTRYSWTLLSSSTKIVPGQSGAPMFTDDGRLAAVAVMIAQSWNPLSRKKHRKIKYEYLGVSVDELDRFVSDVGSFLSLSDYLGRYPVKRRMQDIN